MVLHQKPPSKHKAHKFHKQSRKNMNRRVYSWVCHTERNTTSTLLETFSFSFKRDKNERQIDFYYHLHNYPRATLTLVVLFY